MNTEDRTLLERDLCAHIPYGLKMIPKKYTGNIIPRTLVYDMQPNFHTVCMRTVLDSGLCIPILRNMSDLTNPITHKGETFVPIEELLKMHHEHWYKEANGRYKKITLSSASHKVSACFSFMATKDIDLYILMPYNFPQWIVEKLTEWHFNWRNLPAHLWVDVNTLEQPCY